MMIQPLGCARPKDITDGTGGDCGSEVTFYEDFSGWREDKERLYHITLDEDAPTVKGRHDWANGRHRDNGDGNIQRVWRRAEDREDEGGDATVLVVFHCF